MWRPIGFLQASSLNIQRISSYTEYRDVYERLSLSVVVRKGGILDISGAFEPSEYWHWCYVGKILI
jgi:hypothetical protein